MTREEAVHELSTIFGYGFYNERVDEALNMAIKALEQEPSRATGKWEITINEDYRCDNCGLITSSYKANYCPNCGARMESDTE